MSTAVTALAVNAKTNKACMLPLWEAVERLIGSWAFRYHRNGETRLFDADDLLQAGYLALVDAVSGYDLKDGAEFTTYLHYHIRTRFAEVIGRRGIKKRPEYCAASLDEPLADDTDTSRLDMLTDPDATTAFERVEDSLFNEQLHSALEECLLRLPQEQSDMLRERYYDQKTVKVMAEARGVEQHIIRQKVGSALNSMGCGDNRRQLKEYREEITSRTLRRGGHYTFATTGYSSVEWAVEHLIERGA